MGSPDQIISILDGMIIRNTAPITISFFFVNIKSY